MNLSEKKLQDLKEKKISIEDLYKKYLYTEKDGVNVESALKLLDESICSFHQIVDKFKSIEDDRHNPCLKYLLRNKGLFDELIKNNKLSTEDLRYLLNTIDKDYELESLCKDTPLINYILNEFIFNKEDVDRFNTIIENYWWCKRLAIHTIFEYIEYENKNNEEILKLNELNKKVYLLNSFDLNEEQKVELAEVLKDDEIARNTLIQIVENNLEDQYDFETLKNLLTKEDRKSLKTRFNL